MELAPVSKRVFLTLPDTVYADLERWADLQGRPIANLANYLVERAIEQAKTSGELPAAKESKPHEAKSP
ncbi:MAG: hypothetical protein KME13_22895 [Myxacorys californica WJT36-NPBG1]|jgi:hypothetical protein|nr:hypothetical protein [Myxacorys californica WJT36-NPBG1]